MSTVDDTPSAAASAALTVTGVRTRTTSANLPDLGSAIGRYVTLGELGRGGMGVVLRAYDPVLQREVALKVLRQGTLSDRARSRLLREARAMAQLSHPNVVTVFDVANDDEAGVVLAMELVQGETLATWMSRNPTPAEIIERFIAAGRGLEAAHTAQLLHRDFKPANVLLGPGKRVRVTDFGLARRVDGVVSGSADGPDSEQREASDSRFPSGTAEVVTEAGAVAGTLAYMAPEQHDSRDLTPAADQFAFCASMWHAIAGTLPFAAKTGPELVALKRAGDLKWPRGVRVQPSLVAVLRRGMAVDPGARWPSMSALLEQLQPKSRRRGSLAAITVLAAATAVGGLVLDRPRAADPCTQGEQLIADSYDETQAAEIAAAMTAGSLDYATRIATATNAALSDYAQAWQDSYRNNCEATNIRRDQSAATMDLRMACLLRARAALGTATGLLATTETPVVDKAYAVVERLPSLALCDEPEQLRVQAPTPSDASAAATVATAREGLAEVELLAAAGKYEDASRRLDAIATTAAPLEFTPLLLEIDVLSSRIGLHDGHADAAEEKLIAVVPRALALGLDEIAASAATQLMFIQGNMQRRHDAAEVWSKLAEGLLDAEHASPMARAKFLNHRGSLRLSQQRPVDAEADYRTALTAFRSIRGTEHPSDARLVENIAGALFDQGKPVEAEATLREAMALTAKTYGENHPYAIRSRLNLVLVHHGLGNLDIAEAEARQGIQAAEQVLGRDHQTTLSGLTYLALILQTQERFNEAITVAQSIVQRQTDKHGAAHLDVARARMDLARVLKSADQYARAETEARAAFDRLSALGKDHPETLAAIDLLGDLLRLTDRATEATALLERGAALRAKKDPNSARYAKTLFRLAQAYRHADGDDQRAGPTARSAIAIHERPDGEADEAKKIEAWLAGQSG